MCDLSDRLTKCRLTASYGVGGGRPSSLSLGRRPSTLSLGSCGSSGSRSSLSPASSSSSRSLSSPLSSLPSPTLNRSARTTRTSVTVETRRRTEERKRTEVRTTEVRKSYMEKKSYGPPRPPSGRMNGSTATTRMTNGTTPRMTNGTAPRMTNGTTRTNNMSNTLRSSSNNISSTARTSNPSSTTARTNLSNLSRSSNMTSTLKQTNLSSSMSRMNINNNVNNNNAKLHGSLSALTSPSALLSSSEIKSRIGNRATKTVKKPEKKCASCNKLIEEDAVFALGKLYHKLCLRCGYCGCKIESKFFTRNNKPCCPKCSKGTTEKCSGCGLDIQGDWIEADKNLFHPTCMRCYICDELSKDGFYTHMGKPVCKEHSMELVPNCTKCGDKVGESGFSRGDDILCNLCMEGEVDHCGKCGKDIKGPGEILGVNDINFHKPCLYCVICKENLVGQPITMDSENQIYCTKDYDRKFAAACHYCKKPIVPKAGQSKASRIRALDKDFHINCFKCQDCGSKLEGGGMPGKKCYPYLHLFLCRNCKEKRECESE